MYIKAEEVKELLSKFKFKSIGQVKFHEVDSFKVVHNLSYLYWTENSRVDYCNFLDIGVVPVLNSTNNFSVFLVHCDVDYFSPAHFLDNYLVYTRVKLLGYSSLEFEHIVTLENGEILIYNNSVEVYVDKNKKSIEIPKDIREKIIKFEGDNVIYKKQNNTYV